jgi:hypothetical protein
MADTPPTRARTAIWIAVGLAVLAIGALIAALVLPDAPPVPPTGPTVEDQEECAQLCPGGHATILVGRDGVDDTQATFEANLRAHHCRHCELQVIHDQPGFAPAPAPTARDAG